MIEEIEAPARDKLPSFEGTTLDGETFRLDDYRGQPVVINIWGSWCVPCRTEAPALRRASTRFRSEDVQFVGINVRDNDASAVAFERTFDITYPSINTETSSEAMLAVSSVLPQSAVPSTIILDDQGRVAARVIGPGTYVTFETLINATLKS
ncbi:TlpA disulfide reductase family protein [Nocardioides sp. SOB77]|uniref:TlpA disulfide reductase family protein n=1 Tax=Nocardioides oceani TaxID=3058369 RepID=A0ABT8FN06_9ACTN|nr:TlpA disulfide reductase family protein [Nocardioides oceani]MDN4175787.1 TlpA disulfide reductase family protein [Nocardioides oceani]